MPVGGKYNYLATPGDCSHRPRERPHKPAPVEDVVQTLPGFQTSYWGQAIPVGFGRRKVTGQIVWSSNIRVVGSSRLCDLILAFGYSITPGAERDEIKLVTLYFNGKRVYSLLSSDTISTYADGVLTTAGIAGNSSRSNKPRMQVRWYEGSSTQRAPKILRDAVGDEAVSYRNMMYAVLTNVDLDKYQLSEVPFVEALIAESYTTNNLYDRASATTQGVISVARAVWDAGRNYYYHFSLDGLSLQAFDYNTQKGKSVKSLSGSYAVGTQIVSHGLAADKETGLLTVVHGTSSQLNRAVHIVDPRSLKIGSGYYSGSSSQLIFNSATSGCAQGLCFAHAGSNATEGLFLAVQPDTTLSSANSSWLGILKVNASTLGLSYVTVVNFPEKVTGCWASPEARLRGWAVLYVGTASGGLYRLRIHESATSSNADGAVQYEYLGPVVVTETGDVVSGIYDELSGQMIVRHDDDYTSLLFYSTPVVDTTTSLLGSETHDTLLSVNGRFMRDSDISSGSLMITASTTQVLNVHFDDYSFGTLSLSTVVHVGDDTEAGQSSSIPLGGFWDSRRSAFLVSSVGASLSPACPGPGLVWPKFGYLKDGSGVALSNLLRWLCLYAGYETAEIDVTEVPTDSTYKVLGGQWVNATDVWDEVRLICDAFGIDMIQGADKIKFVKKDRSSTDDDIASNKFIPVDGQLVTRITRQKAEDLPKRVTVSYWDPSIGYNMTAQAATRATFPGRTHQGVSPVEYSLPLVMYGNVARTVAARILYSFWEEQEAIEFMLSREYVWVEPGDILGLTIDFINAEQDVGYWKIVDVTVHQDFSVTLQAVRIETEDDYVFPFTADSGTYNEPTLSGLVDSDVLAFDVPRPESSSATSVELLGASVPTVNLSWSGGTLYHEVSNVLQEVGYTSGSTQPLVMVLESALEDGIPWTVLEQSTTVSIVTGNSSDLQTITATQLLQGENLALVGNQTDGYEYVQFRDVLDNGDGSYTLTGFIRGRRGTEYLTQAWSAGDEFVLVQRPNFLTVDAQGDLSSGSADLASLGTGQELEEAATVALPVVGHSLKPFAPLHPYVSNGASWGSDLQFTFQPRTRGYYGQPTNEAIANFPYDEDTVSFEIDIIDTDGTTVLRTLTTTNNVVTYSAANQATDFASTPVPLYMRIYQISDNSTIDRGYSHRWELYFSATSGDIWGISFFIMNLPLLDDADEDDAIYAAATATTLFPAQVDVYAEFTPSTFTNEGSITTEVVSGVTTTNFSSGTIYVWDDVNTVTVTLSSGSVSSDTDENVMDGANRAAIQNSDGEWEVFGFANATLVSGSTYTLSRLLRGLRGTEYAMRDPVSSGATVVFLNSGPVNIGVDSSLLSTSFDWAAGPSTQTVGDSGYSTQTVEYTGAALRPYSPVNVVGVWSAGDIDISWVRRTRIGGDNWGTGDVPLSEGSENYEVDILDGATVVRTLTSTSETVTYTSAQQTTDFGSPQTTIDVVVYQIGDVYGRGSPATATLSE